MLCILAHVSCHPINISPVPLQGFDAPDVPMHASETLNTPEYSAASFPAAAWNRFETGEFDGRSLLPLLLAMRA